MIAGLVRVCSCLCLYGGVDSGYWGMEKTMAYLVLLEGMGC